MGNGNDGVCVSYFFFFFATRPTNKITSNGLAKLCKTTKIHVGPIKVYGITVTITTATVKGRP